MASDPIDRIAADADVARERVAATIDEIQDRLDPRRIMGDAMDRVTGSGNQLVAEARDLLRSHPLAIGAGIAAIGLALVARNQLARAKVDLGDGSEAYGDYTDYDDGYVQDQAVEAPAPRRAAAATAASADANPMVSILIGLAAGAALGALFPASEAERRALGETGGRIGAAARAAARRAADELDAAGLSLDSVRARASEAGAKARRAARSVVEAARDEFAG